MVYVEQARRMVQYIDDAIRIRAPTGGAQLKAARNIHLINFSYQPAFKRAISNRRGCGLSLPMVACPTAPHGQGQAAAPTIAIRYQVASEVRLIARSTALGRRVSKSRIPTQSGWMKMRVMRG